MTLLLGPPGSGKSTLLMALAGKLQSGLKVRISPRALVTQVQLQKVAIRHKSTQFPRVCCLCDTDVRTPQIIHILLSPALARLCLYDYLA